MEAPEQRRAAADRVPRSHAQTRSTIRLALGFIGAAAIVAAIALARDWSSPRWLALHLLFAGGVVLAISGVSLMLTVTWSAAPAPSDRWAAAQRWSIAIGAAGVAVGRNADASDAVIGTAGAIYLVGLVLLAVLLATTVRRGPKRRFDAAVAAYLAAVAAGLVGVAIGVSVAAGASGAGLRDAHTTANLLGLVGLVVGGTMPFFAATVGRSKMWSGATAGRLGALVAWQVTMLTLAVASLLADATTAAALALGGYAVGIVAVVAHMPRPTRRQLEWSGPRLIALWLGGAWWAVAVVATAVDVDAGRGALRGPWLLVLAVAAYAQILWGSLAYLLPMLRGGGPARLSEGFAATRSWPGLVAVNVAGIAAVASATEVAVIAIGVWVLDAAWRAAQVGTRRDERPAAG